MKIRARVTVDGRLGVVAHLSETAARFGRPYALVHFDDHTAELVPLDRLEASSAPEVRPFDPPSVGDQERAREKARRRAELVVHETPLADIAPRLAPHGAPGESFEPDHDGGSMRSFVGAPSADPSIDDEGPTTPADVSAAGTGLGARAGRAEATLAGRGVAEPPQVSTVVADATVEAGPLEGAPDDPPRDAPTAPPAGGAAPPAEADDLELDPDDPQVVMRGGVKRWTEEKIIELFRAHHDRFGHAPTWRQWRLAEPGRPAATTVRAIFGSWGAALNAAGIPPKPQDPRPLLWTPEAVIEAIQAWAEKRGAPPTVEEWRTAGYDHPTWFVVVKRFGSWRAGIEAAGFTPRRQGRPKAVA